MPDHSAQLVYVLDPMCSWCWGFLPVLRALVGQARAQQVSCVLRVGGLRTGAAAQLDSAKRAAIIQHWHSVQAATGQPFTFTEALPADFTYNTEPACRALLVAQQLSQVRLLDYLSRLQHAFYVQQQDITQAAVLCDLAEQAGYSRQAFSAQLTSAQAIQATQDDFHWVQQLGVRGFPTLLGERGGDYALITNGYQPLERLAPLLSRWLEPSARV